VPLGRLAITVQLIAALVFVGYTLSKKAIRLPLAGEPFQIQVIFPDAKGLDRLDEPAAAVAGTPVGRVTHVEYTNGRALATLTLDDDVRGKVFADASAAIRPASALQNLLVNIDPGTPAAGEISEPIPPWRTSSYVAIDELTSILDADTQAYATILIEQAEVALRGREGELRAALGEVGKLVDTATPIADALADRRRLLTRLVGELDTVARTLGDRGAQLATAVGAGSRTLAVTAGRETELAAVVRKLSPVLAGADRALGGLAALAEPLRPALDELITASAPLDDSLGKLRALLPRSERLISTFDDLADAGRRPLRQLVGGTKGLRRRARGLIPAARDLRSLARRLDRYKGGIAQTAETFSGSLSVQDRGGGYAQIDLVNIEPFRPENFGLPVGADRDRLKRRYAIALERICRTENSLACLFRAAIPGVSDEPLTGGDG
jgi:ABC-type transporter Mla subunit MlaD